MADFPPHVISEWHPDNAPLDTYTLGSNKKVRWHCGYGHEWDAPIYARVKGAGCPYCSGNRVLPGQTDVGTTHPHVSELWADDRDITTFRAGSSTKAIWRCEHEHTWQASIKSVALLGSRCPYCSGRKAIPGTSDAATLRPELSDEWHPDNPPLHTVAPFSHQKVKWLCPQGHEWSGVVATHTPGNCPQCREDRATQRAADHAQEREEKRHAKEAARQERDREKTRRAEQRRARAAKQREQEQDREQQYQTTRLAVTHPEVAVLLADRAVGEQVSAGSNRVLTWVCAQGHETVRSVRDQVNSPNPCLVCAGTVVLAGVNDLATTHPELVPFYSPDNKVPVTSITSKYSRPVRWVCEDGHLWQAPVARVVAGRTCPECRGKEPLRADLIAQYRPGPDDVPAESLPPYSSRKVEWECELGHLYVARVSDRTRGSGCPFCSGNKVLEGFNDLTTTHPEIAAQWHPDNAVEATRITAGHNAAWRWICEQGHVWEVSPLSRTQKESGCPVCAGRVVDPGRTDLVTTHPDIAATWDHEKNDVGPETVSRGNRKKWWWVCPDHGSWQATALNRTHRSSGCPQCSHNVSRGETEAAEYLRSLHGDDQVQTSVRGVIPRMELDIYLPEHKIAVEYHGVYWHSEKFKGKGDHHAKLVACRDAGITLIQVWEDDWRDRRAVVESLLAVKTGVRTGPSVGARKLVAGEVSLDQARRVCEAHHVQGFASGTRYLGLTDPDTGDAVAVLVARRTAAKWYIERYVTTMSVPGGFTRLLARLEELVAASGGGTLVTFSDNEISDGGLYLRSGFSREAELRPDYKYVVQGTRQHKFGYRLKRFRNDPELVYREGLTERELAELNGLYRVWDSGKVRWVREVSAKTGT